MILNLQANFRGILFAPSSPVIILGNGYKLEGFVVAREFVQLEGNGGVTFGNNVNESTIHACTDSWGNVKTERLKESARRRPTSAETPTGQTYEDYKRDHFSNFTDYKKANFDNYEYVYHRAAFNLSNDSYYDSFNIPELERHIYTYLENYRTDDEYADKQPSVDMFFTSVRSKWIT